MVSHERKPGAPSLLLIKKKFAFFHEINDILLSILSSLQSLKSEGDVQVDGTQMKQQRWRNFWERKA